MKSHLTEKIKWDFFQAVAVSIPLCICLQWTLKNARRNIRQLHKNVRGCFEPGSNFKQTNSFTVIYNPNMRYNARKVSKNIKVMFYHEPLQMDVLMFANS